MQQTTLLVDGKHLCAVSHRFDRSRGTKENPTGVAVLSVAFGHKGHSAHDSGLYEIIGKIWKLKPQRFWNEEDSADACHIIGTEGDNLFFIFEFDELVMTRKAGVNILRETLNVVFIEELETKDVPYYQNPHF